MANKLLSEIYDGLRSLAASDFPRKCATCGRVFESSEQFLAETESLWGASGLKTGHGDDDETVVELFRNCPCGSTLLEIYGDRRDSSAVGQLRRERFAALVKMLHERAGLDPVEARVEVLKVLHGERSEVLESIGYGRK